MSTKLRNEIVTFKKSSKKFGFEGEFKVKAVVWLYFYFKVRRETWVYIKGKMEMGKMGNGKNQVEKARFLRGLL